MTQIQEQLQADIATLYGWMQFLSHVHEGRDALLRILPTRRALAELSDAQRASLVDHHLLAARDACVEAHLHDQEVARIKRRTFHGPTQADADREATAAKVAHGQSLAHETMVKLLAIADRFGSVPTDRRTIEHLVKVMSRRYVKLLNETDTVPTEPTAEEPIDVAVWRIALTHVREELAATQRGIAYEKKVYGEHIESLRRMLPARFADGAAQKDIGPYIRRYITDIAKAAHLRLPHYNETWSHVDLVEVVTDLFAHNTAKAEP